MQVVKNFVVDNLLLCIQNLDISDVIFSFLSFDEMLLTQCRYNCVQFHYSRLEKCPYCNCNCYNNNRSAVIVYSQEHGQRICKPNKSDITKFIQAGFTVVHYLKNNVFCPYLYRLPCIMCNGLGKNVCSICHGIPSLEYHAQIPCLNCHGKGLVSNFWENRFCTGCSGKGSIEIQKKCQLCKNGFIDCTYCRGEKYRINANIGIQNTSWWCWSC
jgi:hypothetical protein